MRLLFVTALFLGLSAGLQAQASYEVAVLKYKGGGDYYANPTALPNLVEFCNENIGTDISAEVPFVEVGSIELFDYPMVHLTGHGNVVFNAADADNLRAYLTAGGFLHIDDNYGLDAFIRPQIKKVFPDLEFVELPFSHPIYHQTYDFNEGLPKVHEHDGNPPQGFGLFYEGRMVCFYSYESDLGDGWEDSTVHKDSDETRQKALRMGANIIEFAFLGEN
jgi:hypothetical protein